MNQNKPTQLPKHSHPVLRDDGIPPKRIPPRAIIPVEEPSTKKPTRKPRVGCCG